jgi:TorA maturation chaperone TorD
MTGLVELFSHAALYRAMSLLFQPPQELHASLSEISGSLPEAYRERFIALLPLATPSLVLEYHRLLGPSGVCPDCESDYQENPLGGKGPLLVDIAAFYKAFAFQPEEFKAPHDHISIELGFLGYLTMKRAYALYGDLSEEQALCEDAGKAFLQEHLALWVEGFLLRLSSVAALGFYAEASLLCAEILEPLLPPKTTEQTQPRTPRRYTC